MYLTFKLPEYRIASMNLRIRRMLEKYFDHIRYKIYVRRKAEKIEQKLKQRVN